jgi:hypothetical protein
MNIHHKERKDWLPIRFRLKPKPATDVTDYTDSILGLCIFHTIRETTPVRLASP